MKSTETNKRLLTKCLTYRLSAVCITMFLVWSFTGSTKGAMSIGILDFFIKMGLQFGNEKLWSLTRWGKNYHV